MCGVIFFADPEELQLERLHQQMLPQTCYVQPSGERGMQFAAAIG